ncbi:hypothetical protein GGQ68_001164 [Sagittula marina]|uniref:Uncharacterized protein n=1 Tax=Sagittula marina TaxID=943940 RepID=A0A7W6DKQ5_9RHOB|nr:hypothetical protein [Sagittula marina]
MARKAKKPRPEDNILRKPESWVFTDWALL